MTATRLRPRVNARFLIAAAVVALAAPLLAVVPSLAPPDSVLGRAFSVLASGAGCFDEQGNEVTCPISLDASPLPQGHLVGEQEIASLSRTGAGGIMLHPYEFATGGEIGSCDPAASACRLVTQGRVGPAPNGNQVPDDGDEVPISPLQRAAPDGDAAIVAGDFDGNGQQEVVTALNCRNGDNEICLSLYNPTTNTHLTPRPTGLYSDAVGAGTMRLAADLMLRTEAIVTHVAFRVNDDGGGLIATFTTSKPHGFVPGQPIRFDDPGTLEEALCPSLSIGIDCASDLGLDWRPVADVVDATKFEVQVGEAFKGPEATTDGEVPHVVVPDDWPAGASLGALVAAAPVGSTALRIGESATAPEAPFDISVDGETLTVASRASGPGSSATYTLQDPTTQPHAIGASVGLGCGPCTTSVTGLSPGLALAYDAPTHAAKLATFRIEPAASAWARLIDDRDVGSLGCIVTPCRDSLDITTGDYDGDGQAEIAVATSERILRFYAMADAKQLVSLGAGTDWAPQDIISPFAPYSVSITSGALVNTEESNLNGDDLAIAWGNLQTGEHEVVVEDVTTNFQLRPSTLDASLPGPIRGEWGTSPGPVIYAANSLVAVISPNGDEAWWITPGGGASCGSTCDANADGEPALSLADDDITDWTPYAPSTQITAWDAANATSIGAARRSTVRVAAGDFDADGLDDLVVADSRPINGANLAAAALRVELWTASVPTCTDELVSPAVTAACPEVDGAAVDPVWTKRLDAPVDQNTAAIGGGGSGQLSLAVGRLGRSEEIAADLSFPNQVNPDIVVSWTCRQATAAGSCGTPTAPNGPTEGVAVEPLAVHAPEGDDNTWFIEGTRGSSVTAAPVELDANAMSSNWAATAIALPDLDADSVTLGTPTDYIRTGMVRPLLILRSPPVHFDVFDRDGDGRSSPTETFDINNCFIDYLATGDSYVCETNVKYGVSSTVTSTIGGEVKNSFEIGAEAFVGHGFGLAVPAVGALTAEAKLTIRAKGGFDKQQKGTSEQTFSYASTVATSGGTDAVYAAVVTEEILEYPIFQGATMGFSSNDPVGYASSVSQPKTSFKWTSSDDLGIPLTSTGLVGSNILTYARTSDQLDAQPIDVEEVDQSGTLLTATTSADHGFTCSQASSEAGDLSGSGLDSLDKYPCSAAAVPVEIRGGSVFTGSYLVTRVLSADELQLSSNLSRSSSCEDGCDGSQLVRTPGRFPSDVWRIRRNHRLESRLETSRNSGYEGSLSWFFSAGLTAEASAEGVVGDKETGIYDATSFGLTLNADYTHNETQTMALQVGSDTAYSVTISGDIKPNVAYDVRPFLTQQVDGGVVLDWVAAPNVLDTFWQRYYFEPGPDPAFALPDLLTPYRTPYPNSHPDATTPLLLRSPDFHGWTCVVKSGTPAGAGRICTPTASATTEKPLTIVANIHNYSLRSYDSSRPVVVRFFLGDPSRGGYQIGETNVVSVRSPKCVNRWCLPAQT